MKGFGFDSEKIDRYFSGEYFDNDDSYVYKVFCDDSKAKELKSYLSGQFDGLFSEDDVKVKNLDHILYKIHYDINTRLSERKRWSLDNIMKWTLRIAGSILLPLVIFVGIQTYKDTGLKKETWVEIKAPAWTRAQFSLPDGTTGWLNSNSSIKYNGNFNTDRQVTLTGEAFLDVYKDKTRPFRVNTKEIVIKVLGTRFNIYSFPDEKNVEVVLEEGTIELNDVENNNSLIMHPNDLVTYDKTLKNFSSEVIETKKYLSWTEGKLVFRNDPIDVIARKLERYYNVEIEINGRTPEEPRLYATFGNESLEEVLYFLRRSLPISCNIQNSKVRNDGSYVKKKVIISLITK